MHRILSRLAVTALAVAALVLGPAALAHAADRPDGDITWMVRPSDGVGEDGRAWVELELDPGQSVVEHLLVRNLSASTVTFRLSAADGYFTDTGRFNMLTSDQPSSGSGTWIDLPDEVEVPSGGDVIVPFTLSVPDNATPGDHAAGVAAGIRSGPDDEVGIESRVGFRVMTRVSGALVPAVAIAPHGSYTGSLNPFEPGRLEVDYVVENAGNTRLSVSPEITASALFGLVSFTLPGEPIPEMAPGETRAGTVRAPSVWPLFAYTTTAVATGTSVGGEPATGEETSASDASLVVAVPWPQAVTVILVTLLLWLMWRDRRRRAQTVAARIEQARQEGRDAALTDAATSPRAATTTALIVLVCIVAGVSLGSAVPASAADDPDPHPPQGVAVHVVVGDAPQVARTPVTVPVEDDAVEPRPSPADAWDSTGIVVAALALALAAVTAAGLLLRGRFSRAGRPSRR